MALSAEKLVNIGREAIRTEIGELQRLEMRLDAHFAQAAECIAACSGRLVVVGIGKSAHVGRKIVATLNSTGTKSQFLHAAEAIHGDLGVIDAQDVVLCISHSGNSPEVVAILPYLKQYGKQLIAMTGNLRSKLAEAADIVLDSGIEKEACPNNLAPTSSTTVQLALGDALAVALMELQRFQDTDFAKYHPGGQLGKNLTATVAQFLSATKPEVSPDAGIKEVIISVSASRHGVTVVCENGKIKGVITDGDLRRMLLREDNFSQLRACDIMSRQPKTVEASNLARDAMQLLKTYSIGQLVVVDHGSYAGIVDLHTLLSAGIG